MRVHAMKNKASIILISVIFAVLASLSFLLVEVTTLFITAYIFTLIAVAVILFASLYVLNNPKSYPWSAAVPQVAWAYFIVSIVISALFVVLEQIGVFAVSVKLFVVIQAAFLASLAIRVIALNAGKIEIERVENNPKTQAKRAEFEKEKEAYWK
jgi:hypothetical protein